MFIINKYESIKISDIKNKHFIKGNQSEVKLSYYYKGEQVEYKIQLISKKSNLGNGKIWFFICPYTGKKCRKLYLIDKHFSHKSAFKRMYYESQTHSPFDRILYKFPKADDAQKEINSKYFIKTYRGQPTKRYLKLLKTIRGANLGSSIVQGYVSKLKAKF